MAGPQGFPPLSPRTGPAGPAPEKGGGLEINMPLSLGIVWAILCGDMLTDMEYLTRPYEVFPARPTK